MFRNTIWLYNNGVDGRNFYQHHLLYNLIKKVETIKFSLYFNIIKELINIIKN